MGNDWIPGSECPNVSRNAFAKMSISVCTFLNTADRTKSSGGLRTLKTGMELNSLAQSLTTQCRILPTEHYKMSIASSFSLATVHGVRPKKTGNLSVSTVLVRSPSKRCTFEESPAGTVQIFEISRRPSSGHICTHVIKVQYLLIA